MAFDRPVTGLGFDRDKSLGGCDALYYKSRWRVAIHITDIAIRGLEETPRRYLSDSGDLSWMATTTTSADGRKVFRNVDVSLFYGPGEFEDVHLIARRDRQG